MRGELLRNESNRFDNEPEHAMKMMSDLGRVRSLRGEYFDHFRIRTGAPESTLMLSQKVDNGLLRQARHRLDRLRANGVGS